MFGTEWLILSIVSGTILGGITVVAIWSWFDNKKEKQQYELINEKFDIYDYPESYQKYAE